MSIMGFIIGRSGERRSIGGVGGGQGWRLRIAERGMRNWEKRKVQLATNVTNGHELGEKGEGRG